MHKRLIGSQAREIQEASQCVETLASLLERHIVGCESIDGPVLKPGEVGGIIQALKMAGSVAEIASERLIDAAQGEPA